MKAKTRQAAPRRLLTAGNSEPTRDEFALAAYYHWEEQGRPQNPEVHIWFLAVAQLWQSQAPRGVQK